MLIWLQETNFLSPKKISNILHFISDSEPLLFSSDLFDQRVLYAIYKAYIHL